MELKKEYTLKKEDLIEAVATANKFNKKSIYLIMIMMIINTVLLAFLDMKVFFIFFTTFSIIFILFFLLLIYFTSEKYLIKKNSQVIKNDIFYRYEFLDSEVTIYSKNDTLEATNNIKYLDLVKKTENEKYIYLFINKFNCYIIKKDEFNNEELKILKEILGL